MGIDSILKRIEDEASAYSEQRLKEAIAEKSRIIDEANEEAKRIKDEREIVSDKEAQQVVMRKTSVADLDSRQMILQTKQELIKESFDGAIHHIINMEPEDYIDFIGRQIEPFKDKDGEVLISLIDRKRYGAAISDKLEGSKLRLSEDIAKIKGGCIIKCGNILYNASIEEIIEKEKNSMMTEISNLLF